MKEEINVRLKYIDEVEGASLYQIVGTDKIIGLSNEQKSSVSYNPELISVSEVDVVRLALEVKELIVEQLLGQKSSKEQTVLRAPQTPQASPAKVPTLQGEPAPKRATGAQQGPLMAPPGPPAQTPDPAPRATPPTVKTAEEVKVDPDPFDAALAEFGLNSEGEKGDDLPFS